MPTIRNARGSDMFIVSADETVTLGVQSKALSKRASVPLGANIDRLQSDWWILTIHANSNSPVCYIMTLGEVRQLATQDKNGGAWWLEPKAYDRAEYREAWDRISGLEEIGSGSRTPGPAMTPTQQPASARIVHSSVQSQNGVTRPGPRSVKCAAVWDFLDGNPTSTVREIREAADANGWNLQNAQIEFYRWRKFHAL